MIKSKTFPALADGSALTVEYTYDNAMRLDTLTNKKGATILSAFDYDYDDNDNVVAITSNGQRTDYVYDELDRLTEIRKPGQPTIVYQYDTRGNRKQVAGQEVPVTSQIEYQYDARNQLIQAQRDGQITKFSYEPTGMRAKKESATGTEKYVYDHQSRIVAITDGTNNVKFQIVWGPEAPLLLKDVATGKSYYYVLNGRGDVLQLIDEQGTIVNNYNYDEWGNILNKSEGVKNILRYASEPFDDETGLYYLRARYYDPEMGRFINEDTYDGDITNPRSLNLYTYVENNPLKYIDPTGHYKDSDNSELIDLVAPWTDMWNLANSIGDELGMLTAEQNADALRVAYYQLNGAVKLPDDIKYKDDVIPDVTIKLNLLMHDYERKYADEYKNNMVFRLIDFRDLVANGKELDLKNQEWWENYNYFIYNGEIVESDVPGNITYGYMGKVFQFSDDLLFYAAGHAQNEAETSKPEWQGPPTWGDDPRDYGRIKQGIKIYNEWHK